VCLSLKKIIMSMTDTQKLVIIIIKNTSKYKIIPIMPVNLVTGSFD
jgi:hypothetical protein